MGRDSFSRDAYRTATRSFVPKEGPATKRAEQAAYATGKLDPFVDPAEFGVIRRSLVRFDERDDKLLELTIGCSMPVETRVDTTGSMGDNVEVAIRVLPDAYELCSSVLPGYDLHMATGIFGDVCDRFVLCRPQFEMVAEKIVEQLTKMVPEHNGGDSPEDPHYGIFGGAYLTAAYANCIGLKRYDFTVTDAPARDQLSEKQLIRVFGSEVFDKCAFNGHPIDRNDLPSTKEVVQDLLHEAHAFLLLVGGGGYAKKFWTDIYGSERVVEIPTTDLLPQVQAVIIGLTEGTLDLDEVGDFLRRNNVNQRGAERITASVANIPLGAQVPLRAAIEASGHQIPQAGDLFRAKPDVFAKTNLWPIDPSELGPSVLVLDSGTDAPPEDGPNWL